MEKEYYLQEGQEVEIVCSVVAHPAAFISWHFEICEKLADWPECPRSVQEVSSINFQSSLLLFDYNCLID